MRKKLFKLQDQKLIFTAKIEKYGIKKQFKGGSTPTMLLVNVEIEGYDFVIDHLWVNVGKTIYSQNFKEDSILTFSAWVKPYEKGYVNYREDFFSDIRTEIGINRLSKISMIKKGDGKSFNVFWNSVSKIHNVTNSI